MHLRLLLHQQFATAVRALHGGAFTTFGHDEDATTLTTYFERHRAIQNRSRAESRLLPVCNGTASRSTECRQLVGVDEKGGGVGVGRGNAREGDARVDVGIEQALQREFSAPPHFFRPAALKASPE